MYVKTYARVGPYGFGMWAAYLHFYNKEYDFAAGRLKVIMEWLCFIGHTFIACTVSITENFAENSKNPVPLIMNKTSLGAFMSYLILMMLSPKVDDLPWYRLIKWIRRFFSL